MVRTMENSIPGQGSKIKGFENGVALQHDDLTSDFSIISHPSELPEQDAPQGQNLDYLNQLQFSAIQSSLAPSSLNSIDDIKQQLREIVTENQELKVALEQNSVTLKNWFDTIVNYQDKYNKAMGRQKEIIEKMTKIRESLQEEKESLQVKLDEDKELITELTQDKEKAEKEVDRIEKLLKQAELEVLTMKPELDRQQIQCLHLEETVKELQSEKLHLESELKISWSKKPSMHRVPLVVTDEDNGYAVVHNGGMSFACDEMALMKQSLEAMLDEKSLFVKLFKEEQDQTKKLQAEVTAKDEKLREYEEMEKKQAEKLKRYEQMEKNQLSSWVCSSIAAPPDDKFTMMEEEIAKKSITTVNETNMELEKCQERFTSINQQLEDCQDRLLETMKGYDQVPADFQNLWDEITMLRTIVKDEQDTKETYKKQLEECQLKFQKEYEVLLQQWESYKSEMKTQGRQLEAFSEIEKRTHQEHLDELMAKVIHLEETLQEKERELERIKNQLQMTKRETEQIPILRSQNELYQIELQKMEDVKRETDILIEDKNNEIISLGIQVSQLIDELNVQSGKQLMEMSTNSYDKGTIKSEHRRLSKSKGCPVHKTIKRSLEKSGEFQGAVGGATPKSHEGKDKMVNECPRCNLVFTGYQALNNHVQECCFSDDMNKDFL